MESKIEIEEYEYTDNEICPVNHCYHIGTVDCFHVCLEECAIREPHSERIETHRMLKPAIQCSALNEALKNSK